MPSDRSDLKPMQRLDSHPATWVGRGLLKREYELRSDDALHATLRWESAFGSRAEAAVAGATWTLKRVGFFHPRVTVRKPDSEVDVAIFQPDWLAAGMVEFPSGKRWKWKCLDFWRARYGFLDVGEEPILEWSVDMLKVPSKGKLTVTPQALTLAELPLLVVFGWYVTVLALDDMGMVGATSAAAG